MNIKSVTKAKYTEEFGDILQTRGLQPETIELWNKLRQLTVDSVLVVEVEAGDDLDKAHHFLRTKVSRILKIFKANFIVGITPNRSERHLVLAKFAKSK